MNKFIGMALSCAIALTGCHNANEGEEHHHHHEEHLQLTSYSDSWEVYAEAHPFVTGEESPVLAHMTRLSDFKPLAEGEVTAVLEINGKKVSQTSEVSATPGIFKFSLEPPCEGSGTLTFMVGEEILVTEVKAFSDEEEAEEYAESMEATSSNGASFSKEKSWNVDFATEVCRVEPFGQVIKTMAQVQPSQGEESSVTALTDGVVTIGSGALVEGREVRQGEILCQIKSSGIADNSMAVRYAEAEADFDLARTEYERKQTLAADRIVSDSELKQAESEYRRAKAVLDNLKASFNNGGQSIKSPLTGYITSVAVANGQFVQAGQTIATVSKSRTLQIVAEVQPKYYQNLRNVSGASFRAMGADSIWTLEDLEGKVISYGKSVSAENPMIPVTFSVSNKADFLPGSFIETWIRTTDRTDAVTVANSALIEEQGNYFVYRQLTPELFEKTPVAIGSTDGIRTQIKEGLEGGERIVSKGAMMVKLAQASGALDPHAGHNH